MHNDVPELRAVLPPPKVPRNNSGNWDEVETAIGTCLPDDYKDFVEAYGSVKLFDWFCFVHPFPWSLKTWNGFLEYGNSLISEGRTSLDDGIPFTVVPEKGGLLPIGFTDSRGMLAWITEDTPHKWGVYFLNTSGGLAYSLRSATAVGFLVGLATLTSPLFPHSAPRRFCEEKGMMVYG